jgi:aerobic-type carbon monoxide dehydrogenase small subunit (CoxS/CutS family)
MTEERFRPSRREVLRGAGFAAVVGSVGPALARAGEADGLRRLGPEPVEIGFTLNGEKRSILAEPRVTLLDALRDRLDLTGAKRVCDRGACGACTVLVDGRTCNSCMTLLADVAGAEVTTIEGLSKGDALHPVQAAFVKHDALQCGYCTPGMVMSCAALLDRTKNPTDEEIRAAVAGNLCRCGTYTHVFQACREAAR